MASKIQVDRGTTVNITGTVKEGTTTLDITGATIFFTVKDKEYTSVTTDTDALVSKTVTSLPGATEGIYTVTLDPVDTATIPKGSYYYDIKIKLVDGTIYKLNEGRFILDASPTNRMA